MKSSIPVITIKKLIIKVVVDAKFKGGVCMLFSFTFVAFKDLFVDHMLKGDKGKQKRMIIKKMRSSAITVPTPQNESVLRTVLHCPSPLSRKIEMLHTLHMLHHIDFQESLRDVKYS